MATHSSVLAWEIQWTESLVGYYCPWSCTVGTQLSTRTQTTAILDSQSLLTLSLPRLKLPPSSSILTLVAHIPLGLSQEQDAIGGGCPPLTRTTYKHLHVLPSRSAKLPPLQHVCLRPLAPVGPGTCSRNASSFFSLINLPYLYVNMLLSDHKQIKISFPVSVLPHFLPSLE